MSKEQERSILDLSVLFTQAVPSPDEQRVMAVIQRKAFQVRDRENLPLTREGVNTAVGQVLQALRDALPEGENPPLDPRRLSKLIDQGFRSGRERLFQARSLVKELCREDSVRFEDRSVRRRNLAIPDKLFYGCKKEILMAARPTIIKSADRLLETVNVNGKIIPLLAGKIIRTELETPAGKQLNPSILYELQNLTVSAAFIRGQIAAKLIEKCFGRTATPLLLKYEDLLDLMSMPLSNKDLAPVAKKITDDFLSDQKQPRKAVELIVNELGKQVLDSLRNWNRSTWSKNIAHPLYWDRLFNHWQGFPIQSAFEAKPMIFSAKEIDRAIEENLPHLWQHAEIINGQAVPSIRDLSAAKLYLRRGRMPGQILKVVDEAHEIWKWHYRVMARNPELIKKNEAQVASKLAIVERTKKLVDPETADLNWLPSLRKKCRILRQKLKRFDQVMIFQDELERYRQNPSAMTPELIRVYFSQTRDRNDSLIFNRESRLKTLETKLNSAVDLTAFDYWLTRRALPTVESKQEANSEITRLEKLLKDLRERRQGLPEVFTGNLKSLNKFMATFRPIRKNREERKIIDDWIKSAGTDKAYPPPQARSIMIQLTKRRMTNLKQFVDTENELEDRKSENLIINQALEADTPELFQHRIAKMPPELAGRLTQKIEMFTLPEIVLNDPKNFSTQRREAEKMLECYHKGRSRSLSFRIPSAEELRKTIEVQNKRYRERWDSNRYKIFRNMLMTLGEGVDNPFIPVENAEGILLSQLMEATNHRCEVAEAILSREKTEKELRKSEAIVSSIKETLGKKGAAEAVGRLRNNIRLLQEEMATADTRLLEKMVQLKLTLNPAKLRLTEQRSPRTASDKTGRTVGRLIGADGRDSDYVRRKLSEYYKEKRREREAMERKSDRVRSEIVEEKKAVAQALGLGYESFLEELKKPNFREISQLVDWTERSETPWLDAKRKFGELLEEREVQRRWWDR